MDGSSTLHSVTFYSQLLSRLMILWLAVNLCKLLNPNTTLQENLI